MRGQKGPGVFGDNRELPIHRWYPFVEGFSADMVTSLIGDSQPEVVFDPFGGCGTTALAAACVGSRSAFTEINPYLAWLADVKVNAVRATAGGTAPVSLPQIANRLDSGTLPSPQVNLPIVTVDANRQFFPDCVALQIAQVVALLKSELDGPVLELGRAALAICLVPASNMIRRTDLRRRIPSDPGAKPLLPLVSAALRMIAEDVGRAGDLVVAGTERVGADIRSLAVESAYDLMITSPPYLNGTNYFRNTKLELIALEFIKDESDLAALRSTAITAGINNVSKRRAAPTEIAEVEEPAQKLDMVAYDKRIPQLVRLYFSDMLGALSALRRAAKHTCSLYLDIGDSRFAGISVPTPDILVSIARTVGWENTETRLLRTRRSYDGSPLSQVLHRFDAA